nr:hypothetical protein [Tanacetum cinerariifolium]
MRLAKKVRGTVEVSESFRGKLVRMMGEEVSCCRTSCIYQGEEDQSFSIRSSSESKWLVRNRSRLASAAIFPKWGCYRVVSELTVIENKVMSSPPHSTIFPSNFDIENTFSSTNILDYFSASPGSISPDSSNDFTKYLLDILVFSPLHDDSKMEVIQAYDAIPPPQVVIALPVILPPSPVLSLSPMFDSQCLFPSKEISPKDTETPVEPPILVPLSSSPVRSTTPGYLFDESIFAKLDNSLWIISRPPGIMSSPPHSTIFPFDFDIENTFSSTNILNYFSASPGSISPDSSNDFTKYLLDILVFSPLHDDSKMEVIQAYDAIPPPQVVIALPAILPPSPVLSLSPMFDSQYLFPSKEISPKDIETPVEPPIIVPLSSSPVRSTTPDYLFDESTFAKLDNSLWIISRPPRTKPVLEDSNESNAC